jgi:hypothetical protein
VGRPWAKIVDRLMEAKLCNTGHKISSLSTHEIALLTSKYVYLQQQANN